MIFAVDYARAELLKRVKAWLKSRYISVGLREGDHNLLFLTGLLFLPSDRQKKDMVGAFVKGSV